MATTQQNWLERSTKFMDTTSRNNLLNRLSQSGYDSSTLLNSSNDELMALGETLGANEYERSQRQKDRADTLSDFGAQLSQLTASKMRQKEQDGRIQGNTVQRQGLAQMMSNF